MIGGTAATSNMGEGHWFHNCNNSNRHSATFLGISQVFNHHLLLYSIHCICSPSYTSLWQYFTPYVVIQMWFTQAWFGHPHPYSKPFLQSSNIAGLDQDLPTGHRAGPPQGDHESWLLGQQGSHTNFQSLCGILIEFILIAGARHSWRVCGQNPEDQPWPHVLEILKTHFSQVHNLNSFAGHLVQLESYCRDLLVSRRFFKEVNTTIRRSGNIRRLWDEVVRRCDLSDVGWWLSVWLVRCGVVTLCFCSVWNSTM